MLLNFAAAYDDLNPGRHDHHFYASLADDLRATRVLDLGCGTGTLTRLLASPGRTAVGIDPDPEMLHVAERRTAGEPVEWRLGFSDSADGGSADFAVMSGHVAQVFLDDESWARVVQDLHRALVPEGTLAFESRTTPSPGTGTPARRSRTETCSRSATPHRLSAHSRRRDSTARTSTAIGEGSH